MARELLISTYLFFFSIVFNLFKLFPQKEKVVCVASFGDNIFYATRAIRNRSDQDIIILKDHSCRYPFDQSIVKVIPFQIRNPIAYFLSIYHLATASTILIDNYFGFLRATNFRKETTCIQLWHAAGAIKKFGLMDPSIEPRSQIAKKRFERVYNRFDYTVVGSEKMAKVFRESFGITNESILRTGIPRTDVFFDHTKKESIKRKIRDAYPTIKDKKVILYTPTYRDHQLSNYKLILKIDKLYKELADEFVLFIKLHPAVSSTLINKYDEFVHDISDYYDTNHLLLCADVLITDYSSIPFEYALLEKPIIFYAYDMEDYEKTRGLVNDYQNTMPGPVVFTTEAIIQAIKENKFDKNKINSFATQWNTYSKGSSSANIAKVITETIEQKEAFI